MSAFRTHTCGALRAEHVGQTVKIAGWIHRRRDHGGVAFIDLRDHYGITQIVCGPTNPSFDRLTRLRAESVIGVEGEVIARDPATINPELATGEIELRVISIEVHSEVTNELPVPVFGEPDYPEDIRMRYRFLDLRRETLHNTIMLRSKMVNSFRRRMMEQGFTEFTTPILTASSPEGARDFLVPSRLNPGKFYALPQAPQQFKQLIMVAGFDRYFQIAPCFRDEDPRADRSPTDFYQLDVEMSFVTQDDVFNTMEPVIAGVFEEFGQGKKVDRNWTRISYKDSALWYGTDKPDLRNPIKMALVSEHFKGSGFAIFANLLEQPGTEVRAIPAPGGGSRKFCDRMNAFAQKEGLPGMGYIFWRQAEDGSGLEAAGPLAKNIGPERTEAIRQQLGLQSGDAAFFLGGKPQAFERIAGKARMVIGDELGLTEKDRFAFAWIVDFPMYERDEETGKIDFSHNPFSMPQGGLEALQGDPLSVYAYQYDLACNGYELVSGGIRNHKPEIMFKAFELAGYPASEVEARFGGMVNAFRYGAPPHGGCAAGIERMVMLLAGTANIRDVIMFPMNQNAQDLMMGAPSLPTPQQLRELGLRVVHDDKKANS
ncbi:aspartate-tRNA(Asp/Asn) ligase [Candidatus Phycosocius bacilliformis]|uniref:Aspartate--tRNA(Asp/Asn) ligase n=1 Tax=Candidatus Phycosocius bacilliformis TaxID=1445552 RepID=A0A2P2E7S9_9PROT|nr:aspartate--tRNA ligase [Candidatus Phycosocius bacilliformis]GBF57119.1 aspartate-tRNA(Asp/Asn) ligase [Candidatus Phycosocius bacilliformis]